MRFRDLRHACASLLLVQGVQPRVRRRSSLVTRCGDACPINPGKRYDDWELADPAEQDLAGVRRIRDEIDARGTALIDELAAKYT